MTNEPIGRENPAALRNGFPGAFSGSALDKVRASLSKLHPNCVAALAPSERWTILVDETGNDFEKGGVFPKGSAITDKYRPGYRQQAGTPEARPGKDIALVIPSSTNLRPKPGFHTCGDGDSAPGFNEFKDVIRCVRNASCGVLGVDVNALPNVHSEQWISTKETLLDLILRQLPLVPDRTADIDLVVEQRYEMNEREDVVLKTLCDTVLFRLARAFPERAKNIRITPRFIRKSEEKLTGYVDAIANLWGSPSSRKKELLRETGWPGTCLLDVSCGVVQSFLESLTQERRITPQDWHSILESRKEVRESPYLDTLLDVFGESVQGDAMLWKQLLDGTLRHLDSKAVDMKLLACQLGFLEKWRPTGAGAFPPRLRLLWLAAKLAQSNHLGRSPSELSWKEEMEVLSNRLYLEDAPLCCFADLHLAVAQTNAYAFDIAEKTLSRWSQCDPAIPGARYFGQVQSSLGQHHAFRGDPEGAVKLFREAIDIFGKLTDPDQARRECDQTRAYLVTSMMDVSNPDREALAREMQTYLGGKVLQKTVAVLARDDSAENKYRHAILLRYLVSGLSAPILANEYRRLESSWAKGKDEHPWELVFFYRGVLTSDAERRMECFRHAADMVSGATDGALKAIHCVILGAMLYEDGENVDVANTLDRESEELRKALPTLGEARLAALRGQLDPATRLAPLDLARAVLPFNFR